MFKLTFCQSLAIHLIRRCHLDWHIVRMKPNSIWHCEVIFRYINPKRMYSFITCQYYMSFLGWLCDPFPYLMVDFDLLEVAKEWLLLDIGWFVLFLKSSYMSDRRSFHVPCFNLYILHTIYLFLYFSLWRGIYWWCWLYRILTESIQPFDVMRFRHSAVRL